MWEKFTRNFFKDLVLRDLVGNHMYLFPVDYKTKQKMGQLLQIDTMSPALLRGRSKKIKSRH